MNIIQMQQKWWPDFIHWVRNHILEIPVLQGFQVITGKKDDTHQKTLLLSHTFNPLAASLLCTLSVQIITRYQGDLWEHHALGAIQRWSLTPLKIADDWIMTLKQTSCTSRGKETTDQRQLNVTFQALIVAQKRSPFVDF